MSRLSFLISAAAAGIALAANTPGCGKSAPYKLNYLTEASLISEEQNRTYLVNLPPDYKKNSAAPLILSFHGNTRDGEEQSQTDQFTNENWNSEYIIVYPDGINVYHNLTSFIEPFTNLNVRACGKLLPMP